MAYRTARFRTPENWGVFEREPPEYSTHTLEAENSRKPAGKAGRWHMGETQHVAKQAAKAGVCVRGTSANA